MDNEVAKKQTKLGDKYIRLNKIQYPTAIHHFIFFNPKCL